MSVTENGVPVDSGLLFAGFFDAQNFNIQHNLTAHFPVTFFHKILNSIQNLWGVGYGQKAGGQHHPSDTGRQHGIHGIFCVFIECGFHINGGCLRIAGIPTQGTAG